MRLRDVLHQLRERRRIGEVAGAGLGAATRGRDRSHHVRQGVGIASDGHHVASVTGKSKGDGLADASAGSSDDGDATFDGRILSSGRLGARAECIGLHTAPTGSCAIAILRPHGIPPLQEAPL